MTARPLHQKKRAYLDKSKNFILTYTTQ